ncbi:large conductance mechanosensitive channel protein MscL [Ruicaihuangia caeni]|uniref:Large-conductance mechanosensitive channel n=1 Tax=Ruicaihuangia caeni TaxID=3042517 RepID=A0AAW6T4N8_9MICO|nr:large conductance mechanosensitive channel protein MscL [Klugiella sp. YN-L-19]MDI2098796.1 large conductance mechanosensitive channel protein MscL [Klugiella sp. YN-L-19]
MFAGFKEFIMRGNVIDLAVAVVIGAAFTAIVNALVEGIFNPAIGALFNAESLKTMWVVSIPTTDGGTADLAFGAVVAAVIQFLLVAAVVYFVLVMPINHLKAAADAKRKAGATDEEVPPSELQLLTEIRDLLASRTGGDGRQG